ncbi:MAG: hypothetical protein AAFQ50_16240, partial [Pseudomonadota bacterium]
TLKDAMNDALRDWVTNVRDTFKSFGSGPIGGVGGTFCPGDRRSGVIVSASGPPKQKRRPHRRRFG